MNVLHSNLTEWTEYNSLCPACECVCLVPKEEKYKLLQISFTVRHMLYNSFHLFTWAVEPYTYHNKGPVLTAVVLRVLH